jgi:hypothetical protein
VKDCSIGYDDRSIGNQYAVKNRPQQLITKIKMGGDVSATVATSFKNAKSDQESNSSFM